MRAELDAEGESNQFLDNCNSLLTQRVLEEAEEDKSESEWKLGELSVATKDSSDMSVCAEDCSSEERFVGGDINAVDNVFKCRNCRRCVVGGDTSDVFDLRLPNLQSETLRHQKKHPCINRSEVQVRTLVTLCSECRDCLTLGTNGILWKNIWPSCT